MATMIADARTEKKTLNTLGATNASTNGTKISLRKILDLRMCFLGYGLFMIGKGG